MLIPGWWRCPSCDDAFHPDDDRVELKGDVYCARCAAELEAEADDSLEFRLKASAYILDMLRTGPF